MFKALNVLCVDTSTEACSVAVLRQTENDQIVNDIFMFAPREHTQKILPAVKDVLEKAKLSLPEIDVIAYGRGPGSFTGVRVGISIAQGLAYGIEKPMVGVSTLQAMAQEAYIKLKFTDVYAAIDARMGEVYFAHYQLDDNLMTLVGEEVVIKPADLLALEMDIKEHAALVGTGWDAYPELITHFKGTIKLDINFPSSKYMLEQVVHCTENDATVNPELATPVYLRDKVTWKKLPGRE